MDGNLDAIREMIVHPATIVGLADAGAHVKLICDGSSPSTQLTHWTRDRTRGETIPLEFMVEQQTRRTARLYGFDDRGTIEVGRRADLNVIDLDNLTVRRPGDARRPSRRRPALPAAGRRATSRPSSAACRPAPTTATPAPARAGSSAAPADPHPDDEDDTTMREAIGQILPLAIAAGISPIPIIGVVLMLVTPRARSNGPAFVVGWVVGLAVVGVVGLTVANAAGASTSGSSADGTNTFQIVLGALLVVFALRQWRKRPKPGVEPPMPKWMDAVDHFTPAQERGDGRRAVGGEPEEPAPRPQRDGHDREHRPLRRRSGDRRTWSSP